MSRGEIIIDDNQIKPAASSSSGDWAGEFQQQYSGGLNWAAEFQEQYGGGLNWANQFVHDKVSPPMKVEIHVFYFILFYFD